MLKSHINVVVLSLFAIWSSHLSALEIEGVDVPETLVQSASQQQLVLNGAGVRSKFIFDIYVGALYLSEKMDSAESILNSRTAKRVMMHFVYGDIEREKITDGWTEGFEDNLSDEELLRLKSSIDSFNSAFGKTVKGDEIIIDFLADGTTVVAINQQEKVRIRDHGFQRALLKIWLGDSPVDSGLKAAMLGEK